MMEEGANFIVISMLTLFTEVAFWLTYYEFRGWFRHPGLHAIIICAHVVYNAGTAISGIYMYAHNYQIIWPICINLCNFLEIIFMVCVAFGSFKPHAKPT